MQGINFIQLEGQIQDLLTPFFKQEGYQLFRGMRQFQQATNYGFKNVIISPSIQDDLLIVEINTGYRFDRVEQLSNQFYSHLEGFKPHTNTLITNIGRLKGDKYFRFKMSMDDELIYFIQDIQKDITKYVFPFLAEVTNIYDLDTMLNANPLSICPWIHNQNQRAIKGIVVAKMADNPEFHNLYAVYRRYMETKGTPEEIVKAFNTLYTHLSSISLN